MGLTPTNQIIYANPCKTRSFITHASVLGISQMTFDSADELYKIKSQHKNPEFVYILFKILTFH